MGLKPPSLAVVGSGPAAFYTVLRVAQKIPTIRVDMFEKHAFPFGLTRYGVAPDHPEVRNCQERFAEVASLPGFRFHGNCEIGGVCGDNHGGIRGIRGIGGIGGIDGGSHGGNHGGIDGGIDGGNHGGIDGGIVGAKQAGELRTGISLDTLTKHFDAVLLAYGASAERTLGLPGEDSTPGVLSARSFVGWYNGEPEFQHLDMGPLLRRAETATIIGNGNVALDVARILLRSPEQLYQTDISAKAVEALKQSSVRSVKIMGRRGLLQSAFTTKELRELLNEPGTAMLPVTPSTETQVVPVSRGDKRKFDLIKRAETTALERSEPLPSKTWQLGFLRSPRAFKSGHDGLLSQIEWSVNEYDPSNPSKVLPTAQTEATRSELAFTSIGYRSEPIPGLNDIGGEFDTAKNIVVRNRGKVLGTENTFASGWVATGPVGVIASTMMDSFSVGDEIAQYLLNKTDTKDGIDVPSATDLVSWSDWTKIDQEEVRRGAVNGRPREKFTSSADAIHWLRS